MGRGKLNMELIPNEKTRRTTFQKRRKGIMKKAYELSTLCESDVCMIIYGPEQSSGRPVELQTWPENPDEVNRIIEKYELSTMHVPPKKTVQLSDLLEDRKNKAVADIGRARRKMYEAKYPTWDERIDSLTADQLEAMLHALGAKLESEKKIYRDLRIRFEDDDRLVVQDSASKLGLGGNHDYGEASKFTQPWNQTVQFDSNSTPIMSASNSAEAMWMSMGNNYNYNYNYNYSLQFMSPGASSSSSNSEYTNENMMMFNIPAGSSITHYGAAAGRLMHSLPAVQYPVMPSISPQGLAPLPDHHQTEGHQFDDVNEYMINNRMP